MAMRLVSQSISSLCLHLQSLKEPFKHDLACFTEAFLEADGLAWGWDEEGNGFMGSHILQLLQALMI